MVCWKENNETRDGGVGVGVGVGWGWGGVGWGGVGWGGSCPLTLEFPHHVRLQARCYQPGIVYKQKERRTDNKVTDIANAAWTQEDWGIEGGRGREGGGE